VLADTDSRLISSRLGRLYHLTIALPLGYHERSESYPVLYVVDANGWFATAAEAARNLTLEGEISDIIVVGIGYPVGQYWYTRPRRTFDLTPTSDSAWVNTVRKTELAAGSSRPLPDSTGGAAEFHRFLVEEVIPLVEGSYRVDPRGRALFGHSFGGLFGLYALFRPERSFERFLVSSPSIWWDSNVGLRLERAYAATDRNLPARVFLSVGDSEVEGDGPAAPRMVSNLKALDDSIRSRRYAGLETTTIIFANENHVSVMPVAISRGLRWLYAKARRP
jgi:predicted alpha/beta superfamily hydrolase